MNKAQAEEVLKFLMARDFLLELDMDEGWHNLHLKLETLIKREGYLGLSKVFTLLYMQKRRWVVPNPLITKFYELVHKLLFRELSDALNEAAKDIEEKISKFLINKKYIEPKH